MHLGLITTTNTNIGDDLIRQGIIEVFIALTGRDQVSQTLVNKHYPTEVFEGWHPMRLLGSLPKRLRVSLGNTLVTTLNLHGSRLDSVDCIVQCGAPVYHPNCHKTEWAEIIWNRTLPRLGEYMTIMNLAAGSCLPWERQHGLQEPEMQFISRINGISNVTTVRDKIAHRIVSDCGGTAELLACTAFLSGCSVAPKWNQTSKILINYMEGGGHFDWGQGIDASEYAAEFAKFAAELSEKFDLYWLAHNQEEAIAARRFGCKSDRLLFPKNLQEYLGLPEKFRAAICNRMHASIGLASMGIPSIAIGNDTRLAMVDQIGLKTRYTKTLSFSTLRDDFSVLLDESSSESARLLELRSSTLDRYVNLLRRYV